MKSRRVAGMTLSPALTTGIVPSSMRPGSSFANVPPVRNERSSISTVPAGRRVNWISAASTSSGA